MGVNPVQDFLVGAGAGLSVVLVALTEAFVAGLAGLEENQPLTVPHQLVAGAALVAPGFALPERAAEMDLGAVEPGVFGPAGVIGLVPGAGVVAAAALAAAFFG